MVTHPSTNQVWCQLTLLTETNMLTTTLTKGRFLDLLVNLSVSKPSVNYNLLVKFVRVSEQNLDWLSAN